MKQELDKLFSHRCPDIFRDHHRDPAGIGMCFGFECGDGGFDIIDDLCHPSS